MTRIALASVLALVSGLVLVPNAGAVGELSPAGCIDDNNFGDDVCIQSTAGLRTANSVAVSPDGKSVYATAQDDEALVRFDRSSTGALTPAGCIDDNDTGDDVCARSVNGLDSALSVAVSPDGKSVYVASVFDSAIVRFNRDATGALTPAGCIDDNDIGDDVCAQSINGLGGAASVAVSPDGASVYVASDADDAVVRFNRSSTGALTPAGCVGDNDSAGDSCAQLVNGMEGANAVAVSPDGNSVYVASFLDSAVVRFNRSATGALTSGGCIQDNDSGSDGCAQAVNGLSIGEAVTVSPDGASVYVVSQIDRAIVRFNRSSTGALTPAGCIDDNDDGPDVCAQSVNGLTYATAVAVSPDGKSVYVTGITDNAVVRFGRSPVGALTPGGCIDDNDVSPDVCAQSINALKGATGVTVSPDGASVYAAAQQDSAVVRFNRTS